MLKVNPRNVFSKAARNINAEYFDPKHREAVKKGLLFWNPYIKIVSIISGGNVSADELAQIFHDWVIVLFKIKDICLRY